MTNEKLRTIDTGSSPVRPRSPNTQLFATKRDTPTLPCFVCGFSQGDGSVVNFHGLHCLLPFALEHVKARFAGVYGSCASSVNTKGFGEDVTKQHNLSILG